MKILAINASHQGDKGQTRFFPDRLLQGASEVGAECEVVTLARIRPSIQRQANQEIVSVPLFRFLERLKPIKVRVLAASDSMWSEDSQ